MQEPECRASRQPDGTARTREVKLAIIGSAESRDTECQPVRGTGSMAIVAAMELVASRDSEREPAPFAIWVVREMELFRCQPPGGRTFRKSYFANEQVPDAIQVVEGCRQSLVSGPSNRGGMNWSRLHHPAPLRSEGQPVRRLPGPACRQNSGRNHNNVVHPCRGRTTSIVLVLSFSIYSSVFPLASTGPVEFDRCLWAVFMVLFALNQSVPNFFEGSCRDQACCFVPRRSMFSLSKSRYQTSVRYVTAMIAA